MVGCWTLIKLERILERGLPLNSETLRREEGDLPRWSLSSLSALALFSKSDLRFLTAEEDRCSVMAVWEGRRVYQLQALSHFLRRMTLGVRNGKVWVEWRKKIWRGEGQDGNEQANILQCDCYAAIDGAELTCIGGCAWCV